MSVISASVKWHLAIFYIDNVTVFSNSPQQHAKDIKEVIVVLQGAGMTLKLKKCHSFLKPIFYLNRVTATEKLKVVTIRAGVMELPRYPEDISRMRFFFKTVQRLSTFRIKIYKD